MIRLGLCCKFLDAPIRFRSITATYLKRLSNPLSYLNAIICHNVKMREKALLYCEMHQIGCFRIGSDFTPVITHPEVKYSLEELPDETALKRELQTCGQRAKRASIRLTLHPDPFVVLYDVHHHRLFARLSFYRKRHAKSPIDLEKQRTSFPYF